MYAPAHNARQHAEELERLLLGLSMAEQSFADCAGVRVMCASQNEALASQRTRLGAQRRRLAEASEEAERESRLLYERLAE
jgi:hypothetical protein